MFSIIISLVGVVVVLFFLGALAATIVVVVAFLSGGGQLKVGWNRAKPSPLHWIECVNSRGGCN